MRHRWLADGSKDMTARAYERAKHILANHKPLPVPEAARKQIREFINQEERKRNLPVSSK
jgi:trimethylamine:corrinoid methyltransferase-like protein